MLLINIINVVNNNTFHISQKEVEEVDTVTYCGSVLTTGDKLNNPEPPPPNRSSKLQVFFTYCKYRQQ